MSMKKDKEFSLPMTLFITYLALLTLCVGLYALIQISVEDKSTATNLMIWSATIYAPIAIFFGFNAWKSQQYQASKIKTIEHVKEKLSVFNKTIIDYRLYGKNFDLLKTNDSAFKKNRKKFTKKLESIRTEITKILEKDGFYFEDGDSDLIKLYEFNNKLLDVILEIEDAGDILRRCYVGLSDPTPDSDGTTDKNHIILKRMYLIQYYHPEVQSKLNFNKELKEKCKKYEKEKIYDPIDNFFNYLNDLLRKIYKI